MGWTYYERERYEQALEMFEAALSYRREQGDAEEIHIARWCVAKCLRSLGRVEEALAIQRELEANREHATEPGYTWEEIGECLLALGRGEEAPPYFGKAYERLSQDPWLKEHESERLERLRRLAEGHE
jgi:tetratricopeptide (TPR) repeat protein